MADVYGRKKTFLFGASVLAVFTFASAISKSEQKITIDFRLNFFYPFISTDVITLAMLRAIQGIGAAAMVPAGVSSHFCHIHGFYALKSFIIIQLGILAHAFPPSRARTLAFATFSAGQALGAVFGSNVGGVLTEYTPCDLFRVPVILVPTIYTDFFRSRGTWRSPFYLLAGLAVVVFISGLFSIDADLPSKETDKRVDWIGALLVTTGLVLIIFVLGQGEIAPRQWGTPCT